MKSKPVRTINVIPNKTAAMTLIRANPGIFRRTVSCSGSHHSMPCRLSASRWFSASKACARFRQPAQTSKCAASLRISFSGNSPSVYWERAKSSGHRMVFLLFELLSQLLFAAEEKRCYRVPGNIYNSGDFVIGEIVVKGQDQGNSELFIQ